MSARRAFTVELTDEQIEAIEAHVASGRYADASEVVAAGVAELPGPAWDDDSPEMQAILNECGEIDRRIDAGLEPTYTLDEVMKTLREDLAARGAAQRPAAE